MKRESRSADGGEERAAVLADRFERAHRDVVRAIEDLPEQRWKAICTDTGWPVNVQACHIAAATAFLTDVLQKIAHSEEMTAIPMAALDQENARQAAARAEATVDEALAELRATGMALTTFVRGLNSEQLDRIGVFVREVPPMTVEQIVEQVAMGELLNHGGTLRQAGTS